ncbi:MAG TPA: hypothetical protein VFV64_02115 [Permianibacter sp.]|nr:hypothetical protein [Permianibacter sp.]
MRLFGDQSLFAFGVHEDDQADLRKVDIFIGGRNVCCDDNCVYLPHFAARLKDVVADHSMKDNSWKYERYLAGMTVEQIHTFLMSTRDSESENYGLEDDRLYPYYRFLDWGPTTDNLTSFLFPFGNELYLTYEFWRDAHKPKEDVGRVFGVSTSQHQIVSAISDFLAYLK